MEDMVEVLPPTPASKAPWGPMLGCIFFLHFESSSVKYTEVVWVGGCVASIGIHTDINNVLQAAPKSC